MFFIGNFTAGMRVGYVLRDYTETDKVRRGLRTKHVSDVPALKHVCHLASQRTTFLACIRVWRL